MTSTEAFLAAMLAIIAIPYLVWRLGRTDHYAPLVVVQIIVGILLGPGVFGAWFPAAHHELFDTGVMASLNGLAWWGVMLFVWTAGIELHTSQLWREWRDTTVTASLALGVPLLLGAAAAACLLAFPGWRGASAAPWQFVAGIGMSCAITALPILVLFMERLAILRHPLGQRVLRYASFDDIAIWGVLAVILADWDRIGWQAGFLVLFAACTVAIRQLMPRIPEADRWHVGLVWLAGSGWLADWFGFHYMVGAFLSGAVLDARWFNQVHLDRFRQALLLTVMPVFFLSTGLRTSWTIAGAGVMAVAAVLLTVSVVGKLTGVALAARLLGWPKGEAAVIGWLLQTKALIMLIFASILLDRGIVTPQTFTALLLMAIGSTMLTIPVVTPRWLRLEASRRSRHGLEVIAPAPGQGRDKVAQPPTLELTDKEP